LIILFAWNALSGTNDLRVTRCGAISEAGQISAEKSIA